MDRICERSRTSLTLENFHRLFLTSVLVSVKYSEDKFYSNAYYSKVGGIPLTDLNTLEAIFLNEIEYSLFVSDDAYDEYVSYLSSLIKMRNNSSC